MTLDKDREYLRQFVFPDWLPAALIVAATTPFAVYWWGLIANGSVAFDWRIFVEAGERAWARSPDLYEITPTYSFRHSPLLAYAMPAIAWLGTTGIRLLTVAAAFAMPTWPMRLLAIASWPFAMDAQHGALITILVLAAAWALRGSRPAGIAFFMLALLSPRPLMIPVVAFLLWRQPLLRMPAVVITVVSAIGVLATGYTDDWLAVLTSRGLDPYSAPFNLSPTRLIGSWWIPLGLGAAAWLTLHGRPGIAALAISPYVLPHYLLFGLLELAPPRSDRNRRPASALATQSQRSATRQPISDKGASAAGTRSPVPSRYRQYERVDAPLSVHAIEELDRCR